MLCLYSQTEEVLKYKVDLSLIVYKVDPMKMSVTITAGFRRRRTDNFGPNPDMSEQASPLIGHPYLT